MKFGGFNTINPVLSFTLFYFILGVLIYFNRKLYGYDEIRLILTKNCTCDITLNLIK